MVVADNRADHLLLFNLVCLTVKENLERPIVMPPRVFHCDLDGNFLDAVVWVALYVVLEPEA